MAGLAKVQCRVVDASEIIVHCPKCNAAHEFVRLAVDRWKLNAVSGQPLPGVEPDDHGDWFEFNHKGLMRPGFVCRRERCDCATEILVVNMP